MRLQGKIVLVTGAASGIGAACAHRLGQEGARIILTDSYDEGAHKQCRALQNKGYDVHFLHLDVEREEDWKAAMDYAKTVFGRLDVLVNNAGVLFCKPMTDTSLSEWKHLMSVNLDGLFLGMRAAFPLLKDGGGGSIINLSSIAGLVGFEGLSAYCASKGGVRLLTKVAALEGAPHRIRVNSIHPGGIDTPMLDSFIGAANDPVQARKGMEQLHALGHIGQPDDIAWGVVYLASDESQFVTGSELVIDGGATAR